MSWMQRLKRVFAIDIETCPECGGRLRVIACIEDPPLIAKILGHVRRREVLIGNTPRSPPVFVTTGTDTHLERLGGSPGNLSAARRVFRLIAWIQRPDHLVECFQTPARLPTAWIFQP
jgi:hypothetical protein